MWGGRRCENEVESKVVGEKRVEREGAGEMEGDDEGREEKREWKNGGNERGGGETEGGGEGEGKGEVVGVGKEVDNEKEVERIEGKKEGRGEHGRSRRRQGWIRVGKWGRWITKRGEAKERNIRIVVAQRLATRAVMMVYSIT